MPYRPSTTMKTHSRRDSRKSGQGSKRSKLLQKKAARKKWDEAASSSRQFPSSSSSSSSSKQIQKIKTPATTTNQHRKQHRTTTSFTSLDDGSFSYGGSYQRYHSLSTNQSSQQQQRHDTSSMDALLRLRPTLPDDKKSSPINKNTGGKRSSSSIHRNKNKLAEMFKTSARSRSKSNNNFSATVLNKKFEYKGGLKNLGNTW